MPTTLNYRVWWIERQIGAPLNADQSRAFEALCSIAQPYNLPLIHGHWTGESVHVGYASDDSDEDDPAPNRPAVEIWPDGGVVRLRSFDMATHDMGELTALVIHAHRLCVRVDVAAEMYMATDTESTVSEYRPGKHPDYRGEWVDTGEHPRYPMPCLRVQVTARKPDGEHQFDRHPSLADLMKRIERLSEVAATPSDQVTP